MSKKSFMVDQINPAKKIEELTVDKNYFFMEAGTLFTTVVLLSTVLFYIK